MPHSLRLTLREVPALVASYDARVAASLRDAELTRQLYETFANYRRRGHLTPEECTIVCKWKSPRAVGHLTRNRPIEIKRISSAALEAHRQPESIETWIELWGVSWPTASVFMHFMKPDRRYPILDFRAVWSLGIGQPPTYSLGFWLEYVAVCRGLATRWKLDMRTLDKALWECSKQRQVRPKRTHSCRTTPTSRC